MKQLLIRPEIHKYDKLGEFCEAFNINENDLLITLEPIYKIYIESLNLNCKVLLQSDFGVEEPSDDMVEAMYKKIQTLGDYNRVIAIGGGGVLDTAKLFVLKQISPVEDLFMTKIKPVKEKELILIPTTCGTGSEVTNISILALNRLQTKKGLAVPELFADYAVLVPELVTKLPFKFFATSSIDALVHAVESALSPKANEMTKMFSYKAINMILNGFKYVVKNGNDSRVDYIDDFLMASTYAGIAFGNAGCAAVHALSYPLGAVHHVPHGESNYAMFTGVLTEYMDIKSDGEIATLNQYMADILGCDVASVYQSLEDLLNNLIQKKPLNEYGMTEAEIDEFTQSVMENQTRLMVNNFVELDKNRVKNIYKKLYN